MSAFVLHLQSATQYERIDGVCSFVGEDASGSFGILPRHARFMTSLVFGLSRFRGEEGAWRYLAVPGALLYCVDNELVVSTRRYLLDDDYQRISRDLLDQLLREEEALHEVKQSLHRLEEEILKRLWKMNAELSKGNPD
ncbi:MAG: hypothetical protein KGZ83_16940 [Sulfuricella sp.]|nr:hypothetical protein [Sulfuricella sp.]